MRLLFLLLVGLVFLPGCGGGGEGRSAERASVAEVPEREPTEAPTPKPAKTERPEPEPVTGEASGYGLEQSRDLPADVARQIAYEEGGDGGCMEFLGAPPAEAFAEVSWDQGLDAVTDRKMALGNDAGLCVNGLGNPSAARITIEGPQGTREVPIEPRSPDDPFVHVGGDLVMVFLDHFRAEDMGEHTFTVEQGSRKATGTYEVVEPIRRTVRLLNSEGKAGSTLRIVGAGFRPGEAAGVRLYECGLQTEKRTRLRAVIPVRADEGGSFFYDLRTRKTDAGCVLVRAHTDEEVLDEFFTNMLIIRGGRPDPVDVATAERDGCRDGIEVEGTSCEEGEQVAKSFRAGLRDGEECLGVEDCSTGGRWGRYLCDWGRVRGDVVCEGVRTNEETYEEEPAGTTVRFSVG